MTFADDSGPAQDGDDIVAAEYVLGVLPADERAAAARRIERDAGFARLVERWEAWFAPVADGYAPVEPPAAVKAAIDRRLSAAGAVGGPSAARRLWASLAFWRVLAVAAIAALAVHVAIPYVAPPVVTPSLRLAASLAADGSDVRYLAVYDAAGGAVSLSHVSGERGAGHDFELWMVEGQGAPVSMGVIPAGDTARMPVAPQAKARLDAGAVLAISLEPAGGSPNGKPTTVVATGELKSI
jgi:anti-sigma-K factor RskA